MKTFETTAGMNWLFDLTAHLNHFAKLDGYAEAQVAHSWDYKKQEPYAIQPVTRVALRITNNRYTYYVDGQRVSHKTYWQAITR